MVLPVGARPNAIAGARLRDFEIQSAAELGRCSGAQSFRALCRRDGTPVLVHKFRPADSLLELGPVIEEMETGPLDFAKPFVTRFTNVFAVAGSAYLVEPLPACVGLGDVWRYVLLNRPHEALTIAAILVRQLHSVLRQLARHGDRHGALAAENIVLTSVGTFGVLTASLECEQGVLWLRKDPQEPVVCDFLGLARVLRSLLGLEGELARLRNTSALLAPAIHDGILDLVRGIEQTRRCVRV